MPEIGLPKNIIPTGNGLAHSPVEKKDDSMIRKNLIATGTGLARTPVDIQNGVVRNTGFMPGTGLAKNIIPTGNGLAHTPVEIHAIETAWVVKKPWNMYTIPVGPGDARTPVENMDGMKSSSEADNGLVHNLVDKIIAIPTSKPGTTGDDLTHKTVFKEWMSPENVIPRGHVLVRTPACRVMENATEEEHETRWFGSPANVVPVADDTSVTEKSDSESDSKLRAAERKIIQTKMKKAPFYEDHVNRIAGVKLTEIDDEVTTGEFEKTNDFENFRDSLDTLREDKAYVLHLTKEYENLKCEFTDFRKVFHQTSAVTEEAILQEAQLMKELALRVKMDDRIKTLMDKHGLAIQECIPDAIQKLTVFLNARIKQEEDKTHAPESSLYNNEVLLHRQVLFDIELKLQALSALPSFSLELMTPLRRQQTELEVELSDLLIKNSAVKHPQIAESTKRTLRRTEMFLIRYETLRRSAKLLNLKHK